MIKKAVIVLIFFILMPFLFASPSEQRREVSFNEKFSEARNAVAQGEWYRAKKIFEELLVAHPHEITVYDAYATLWEGKGHYRKALQIYRKWLEKNGEKDSVYVKVTERIHDLESKVNFQKLMKESPLWKEARISGNQYFVVKTNLMEPYSSDMIRRVGELMEKEQQMLEEIFGGPPPQQSYLKVYLTGKSEDYVALRRERVGHLMGRMSSAVYFPATQEILIFAQDQDDGSLSHELAHHLLRGYVANPSQFIDEGMAEYLSYKLEKTSRSRDLRNNLEILNWAYDQGQLEDFFDLFDRWNDYLSAQNKLNDHQVLLLQDVVIIFYFTAWHGVSFFVETKDVFFKDFFRDYLKYEAKRDQNDLESVFNYFKTHLNSKQLDQLNDAWIRYGLRLNYDDI